MSKLHQVLQCGRLGVRRVGFIYCFGTCCFPGAITNVLFWFVSGYNGIAQARVRTRQASEVPGLGPGACAYPTLSLPTSLPSCVLKPVLRLSGDTW